MEQSIGLRVIEVRGALSQAAFATTIGVHKNTVGRIERCEYTPDGEFLQALYREFGVSPTWVLTGVEPKYVKPGFVVGAALVEAMRAWAVTDFDEQLRLLEVDGETLTCYMAGNRLPDATFMARFAEKTGYPIARLNAAYAASLLYASMEEEVAGLPQGAVVAGKVGPRTIPALDSPLHEHEIMLIQQYRAANSEGQYLIECVCDAVAKPSLTAWLRLGQAMSDTARNFEKKPYPNGVDPS